MRLDRRKFLAWLESKQPDEIVGKNRSPSCPIANFYDDASGGCEIIIFERWGEHYIDRGYSTRPMPPWADRFVTEVDKDEYGDVTARRAIEILST